VRIMSTDYRLLSLLIITIFLPFPVGRIRACSTVLLRGDGVLLVGHNLDETTDLKGFVCINKRDYYKVGSTWNALRTYSKHLPYSLNWISKYGSVTWSSIGRDLPDAGINEAGLLIEEMSLAQCQYPLPLIQPRLFQMQWIQYHLDNFRTVEQVIQSASLVIPDGWPWHFFIADKRGNCATLEYIDNKLVVHTNDTLPVTALCNSTYEDELERLKKYSGFGGKEVIDVNNKNLPRFVRSAHMLKTYDPTIHNSPVDYVFTILDSLGANHTRRSYVVDMINDVAYFRTGSNATIRHFSLKLFDFSCNTPVRILDMNVHASGDVTDHFQDYTFQANREIAESWVKHVIEMYPDATEKDRLNGGFSSLQIDRYARYPELSLAKTAIQMPDNEYGLSALFWAAHQGSLSQVRNLLRNGADVNTKTAIGTTPLIGATQAGNLDIVQYLINSGADINLADRHGNTALITAVVFGQSDIAASLMQAGANVNLANKADWTPLHYAAANGYLDLLRLLLTNEAQLRPGSETDLTALMLAASAGKLDVARCLLAEGEDPNAVDTYGNNALLIALKFKQTDVAQELIRVGINVAISNKQDETPWSLAADNKDKKIMGLLKEAGVKPSSYTVPLVFAVVVAGAFSLLTFRIRSKKRLTNETSESSISKSKTLWNLPVRATAIILNTLQLLIGVIFIGLRGLPVDKLEWLIVVIWFSAPMANLMAMTWWRQRTER
jgi:ankyrin repeat protein/penicillin V acylase-like amidase (Ntn superfamily)